MSNRSYGRYIDNSNSKVRLGPHRCIADIGAQTKIYKCDKTHKSKEWIVLSGKTWSTRLDKKTEKEIETLIKKSDLKEAEVLRRLVIIGLKNVKEPADLLRT